MADKYALPAYIGERFIYRNEIYEYIGLGADERYNFRSKRHLLTYHPLRFLEDIGWGRIKRVLPQSEIK